MLPKRLLIIILIPVIFCIVGFEIFQFVEKKRAPTVKSVLTSNRSLEHLNNSPLQNQPLQKIPQNLYAYTGANRLSKVVTTALPRVYVPNSRSNTLSVIDSNTYKVIATYPTGKNPQHVVPSYDLKTLWILNDKSSTVTPIDPVKGVPGKPVHVLDPYNLYFTPDGQFAIVVAEGYNRLELHEPHTMQLIEKIPVACKGINHMDFTVDGRYAIITCEFSGKLAKLHLASHRIVGYLQLGQDQPGKGSMPQDVRAAPPDGHIFYVADMTRNGVFLIDPYQFKQIGFIPTGVGTHSVYPSRDGKLLYVANRGCQGKGCNMPSHCPAHGPGSVSVIDPFKEKVIATWSIPGGGSPDMGNVSADGKELWLSGRYDSKVYVFDTASGKLIHRIAVGKQPHGLCVWPQPGRYSLGHTGNMR